MGIFKVEGTIGDVTFYKSQDGFLMREKGGLSGQRIASDPAFIRTRENNAEFGRAGKAGKTLRAAFRGLLQNVADSRLVSRLTKEMMRVVKADSTSLRGQRNVLDGELELLEGFEFNIGGKLTQTLFAPYIAGIDRVAGSMTIALPAFVPATQMAAPAEATHFQLLAGRAEIDFEAESFTNDTYSSAMLPLSSASAGPLEIEFTVTAGSTKPLFLVLGVAFYQQVNGQHYSLKNGAYNALAMVKVSGV